MGPEYKSLPSLMVKRGLDDILKTSFTDYKSFLQLMKGTNCMISGSSVLKFILGADWTVKDLDLYCLPGKEEGML